MQIATGLHRIGSDMVNSYLVVDPDGVTIIDAGLPGYWRYLESELDEMGRSLDDVAALVLTHGDSDHIGFAARLHHERGVPVYVHEADVPRARLEVKKPSSSWGPVTVGPLARFLWYSMWRGGLRPEAAAGLQPLADGQVLDVPGRPRVIHVPGHTPGSIAVHVPQVDALFLGDAMTTRNVLTGAEGPEVAPFTLDRAAAVASLARVEAIDATWVLPGHGPAWDGGSREAVRRVREAAGPAAWA